MEELSIYAFETIAVDVCIPQDKKIRVLKQCLELGVDINYNDSAILFSAIFCDNYDVLCFLIDNGINVTARDNLALVDVCGDRTMIRSENKLKFIKLLISHGADPSAQNNQVIMVLYSQESDFDIIKFLIENGMDQFAHNNRLFVNACIRDNLELVKYLINVGVNCANITSNILYGSIELQKLLLDNDYNPNTIYHNMCLLEHKLRHCDINGCKLLFEYGADPNCCHNIIDKKYNVFRGFISTMETKIQLIELFLEHGLDISGIFDR